MKRPDCIRHWRDIEGPDEPAYPDSDERFSIGAPLARRLGLTRLGIHHERLPPGRRTSYPQAESDEEDFIYVLEKLNKGNAIKAYMVRHDENESVEYLLEYGLDNMKAKQNKIYGFPLVISNQRNTHNFYSDEMIELMEAFVNKLEQEGNDSKDIEEMLASFTEMKKQETSKDVETCYYLYKIVYLNKFLNTMTGMKIYDEDFFKGLMVEAKNQAFKFLEDLKVKRAFLETVCKKESFTKSEPFTFNDLDNHVWMEDDILLVNDQY